jgi:hypothetical protein
MMCYSLGGEPLKTVLFSISIKMSRHCRIWLCKTISLLDVFCFLLPFFPFLFPCFLLTALGHYPIILFWWRPACSSILMLCKDAYETVPIKSRGWVTWIEDLWVDVRRGLREEHVKDSFCSFETYWWCYPSEGHMTSSRWTKVPTTKSKTSFLFSLEPLVHFVSLVHSGTSWSVPVAQLHQFHFAPYSLRKWSRFLMFKIQVTSLNNQNFWLLSNNPKLWTTIPCKYLPRPGWW